MQRCTPVASVISGMILAVLLLIAAPARAKSGCSIGAGARSSFAPAERDWDLTTPRDTVGLAPSLSARCHSWIGFFGVDASPGLRHGYRTLNARGPLAMHLSFGVAVQENVGVWTLSNGAMRGYGVFVVVPTGERSAVWVRSAIIPGPSPTVMLDIQGSWDFNGDGPHDRGVLDPSIGVELGTVWGLRADFALGQLRPGVRVAMLHRVERDVLLSPVGLGTLVIPFNSPDDDAFVFAEVAGGARWTGSETGMVGGASLGSAFADGRIRSHVGVLVLEPTSEESIGTGEPQVVFDFGLTLMVF